MTTFFHALIWSPIFESSLYVFVKIVLAVFLGLILGTQRKMYEKTAGPRTYALVCFSSAVLAIIGMCLTKDRANLAVIAAIISGIGFLGAGTILHREDRVSGLTTAAGLWVSASIGIAIGADFIFLGILSAILTLLIFATDDREVGTISFPVFKFAFPCRRGSTRNNKKKKLVK